MISRPYNTVLEGTRSAQWLTALDRSSVRESCSFSTDDGRGLSTFEHFRSSGSWQSMRSPSEQLAMLVQSDFEYCPLRRHHELSELLGCVLSCLHTEEPPNKPLLTEAHASILGAIRGQVSAVTQAQLVERPMLGILDWSVETLRCIFTALEIERVCPELSVELGAALNDTGQLCYRSDDHLYLTCAPHWVGNDLRGVGVRAALKELERIILRGTDGFAGAGPLQAGELWVEAECRPWPVCAPTVELPCWPLREYIDALRVGAGDGASTQLRWQEQSLQTLDALLKSSPCLIDYEKGALWKLLEQLVELHRYCAGLGYVRKVQDLNELVLFVHKNSGISELRLGLPDSSAWVHSPGQAYLANAQQVQEIVTKVLRQLPQLPTDSEALLQNRLALAATAAQPCDAASEEYLTRLQQCLCNLYSPACINDPSGDTAPVRCEGFSTQHSLCEIDELGMFASELHREQRLKGALKVSGRLLNMISDAEVSGAVPGVYELGSSCLRRSSLNACPRELQPALELALSHSNDDVYGDVQSLGHLLSPAARGSFAVAAKRLWPSGPPLWNASVLRLGLAGNNVRSSLYAAALMIARVLSPSVNSIVCDLYYQYAQDPSLRYNDAPTFTGAYVHRRIMAREYAHISDELNQYACAHPASAVLCDMLRKLLGPAEDSCSAGAALAMLQDCYAAQLQDLALDDFSEAVLTAAASSALAGSLAHLTDKLVVDSGSLSTEPYIELRRSDLPGAVSDVDTESEPPVVVGPKVRLPILKSPNTFDHSCCLIL